MSFLQEAKRAVGRSIASARAGAEKLALRKLGAERKATIVVTSPVFQAGEPLPVWTTADGESKPPPLQWSQVPPDVRSIVVICEDPDAPTPEPFVHWLVYDIPAAARALEGTARTGVEGKNSMLRTGYAAPTPPPGHGRHHYHFQVFALDVPVHLEPGVGRGKLFDAMRGHVIACGDLVGTYERA